MKRLWTEEEINILKRMFPNSKRGDIESKIDRTWKAIEVKAEKLGIKRNTKNFWNEEEKELFKVLYPIMSNKELSNRFNRTVGGIVQQAVRLGITKIKTPSKKSMFDMGDVEKHVF